MYGSTTWCAPSRDSARDHAHRQPSTRASNVDRVIESVRSLESFKQRSYQSDRITAIFLIIVTGLLVAVAALGIFGLATFNVSTRTKQIGTRRAVGARKRDIVRYFMVENGLITTAGIVVGCALALGVGYWLSLQYQSAAPGSLLPGGRHSRAVGHRPARSLAAGPSSRHGISVGRDPYGVTLRAMLLTFNHGQPGRCLLTIEPGEQDDPRHRRQRGSPHGVRRTVVAARRAGGGRRDTRGRPEPRCRVNAVDLVIQDMNFRREATSGEEGVALFREIRRRASRYAHHSADGVDSPGNRRGAGQGRSGRLHRQALGRRRLLTTVRNLLDLRSARAEAQDIRAERREAREALGGAVRSLLASFMRARRCIRWCAWRRRLRMRMFRCSSPDRTAPARKCWPTSCKPTRPCAASPI